MQEQVPLGGNIKSKPNRIRCVNGYYLYIERCELFLMRLLRSSDVIRGDSNWAMSSRLIVFVIFPLRRYLVA